MLIAEKRPACGRCTLCEGQCTGAYCNLDRTYKNEQNVQIIAEILDHIPVMTVRELIVVLPVVTYFAELARDVDME